MWNSCAIAKSEYQQRLFESHALAESKEKRKLQMKYEIWKSYPIKAHKTNKTLQAMRFLMFENKILGLSCTETRYEMLIFLC